LLCEKTEAVLMARRIVVVVDDALHEAFRAFCDRLKTSMQKEIEEHIKSIIGKEDERKLADEDNGND